MLFNNICDDIIIHTIGFMHATEKLNFGITCRSARKCVFMYLKISHDVIFFDRRFGLRVLAHITNNKTHNIVDNHESSTVGTLYSSYYDPIMSGPFGREQVVTTDYHIHMLTGQRSLIYFDVRIYKVEILPELEYIGEILFNIVHGIIVIRDIFHRNYYYITNVTNINMSKNAFIYTIDNATYTLQKNQSTRIRILQMPNNRTDYCDVIINPVTRDMILRSKDDEDLAILPCTGFTVYSSQRD